MCPVFTLDYEISTWKPAVYETAAATFRVVNEIQSGAKLTLMARLWKLERLLRSFLNEINEPTTTTAETRKPVTEVDVKWAIGALGDLGQSLEEMYTNAKRLRLTNGTFIGPVLDSIRTQADEILDLSETLELAINPRVEQRFAEVEQEHERGETIPLSSL